MQSGKIKISSGNVQDSAFVTGGYFNWKDTTRNFKSHEGTSIHKKAVSVVITEPKTIGDVGEMLSSTLSAEKQTNRQHLLKVAESVKFLARQAIPYCGNGDEGNFLQLMKLRAIDVPSITTYLQCKTDKYVSPQVQNELTMIMANHILRDILSISINKAKYFALMADEVTDISNKEQVVICLRYVDDKFEPQEDFIGLCSVNSITADALVSVFKDAMLRMNLSIQNCRGQCFDGAANMCGFKKGAATQITSVESRAVFIHCYGHALNLAIGDTIKSNKILRDTLHTTYEISKLLKYSPKEKIKAEINPGTPGFRTLCPTQWTVRGSSLESVRINYKVFHELWEEAKDIVKDSKTRARIVGVQFYMKSFDYLFGMVLGERLLKHTDNLSKTFYRVLV